jgi:DNA-binding transcriptional LysR family regulator
LTSEIVFEDRLYIAAGIHSRWALRRKVDITELAEEPWLVPPPGSWSWSFVAEAFAVKGCGMPNVKVATYSVPLLRSLPSSGKLITVEGGLTLHFVGKQMGIKALPMNLPRWP